MYTLLFLTTVQFFCASGQFLNYGPQYYQQQPGLVTPGPRFQSLPPNAYQLQTFNPFLQNYPLPFPSPVSSPPQPISVVPDIPRCKPSGPKKLDWGDCPQLEPKEEDKKKKEEKLKECFKDLGLNENSTLEELDLNIQEKAKECALRKEELLNDAGKYNFDKAEEKIKAKGLPEDKQKKILESHVECKHAAEARFYQIGKVLTQVEMYENCMDFHISMICNIKEYQANKTPYYHLQPMQPPQAPFRILGDTL